MPRTMRDHVLPGCTAQYSAASVWCWVRVEFVLAPIDFTSSNSRAYCGLVSGQGPFVRNCNALLIRNGVTFRIHPFGSFPLASGTQSPGPGTAGTVKQHGPNRPSPVLAAIIAFAAATPAAIPPAFAGLSGVTSGSIAGSVLYVVVSAASCSGRMLLRTWYAAVAAAASCESNGVASGDTRYGV